jgi:hypothetical protein
MIQLNKSLSSSAAASALQAQCAAAGRVCSLNDPQTRLHRHERERLGSHDHHDNSPGLRSVTSPCPRIYSEEA